MLLDINNLCSDNQDLAQAAGSYLSDHSIDLGAVGTQYNGATPDADVGKSDVDIFAQVTETFTSGGSATVQAQLVTADDGPLTSNLVVIQETSAIPVADLVAGYRFRISDIPPGIAKRYLGFRFVIGTAATTAGKVTAGVAVDVGTARMS